MENKNSAFKEYFNPILVLVLICFVVTFLLAFTYGITAPIIAENNEKTASEARTALLPEADGFTASEEDFSPENDSSVYDLEEGKVYATDIYTADNGAGMVVTVVTNSYGGALTCMVGVDADGGITGVQVTDHADTAGVGTKAHASTHLEQYIGVTSLGSDVVKQHAENTTKDGTNVVNEVTGASVSSGALHKAVYCALDVFKEMGGVK